jgi:glycosyltransferase involved in cell wall biosynthesis
MRVLVLTSMFPHDKARVRGTSIYKRTVAFASRCKVQVVSPQTLPGLTRHGVLGGIEVRRPRWWRVPKAGAVLDGYLFRAFAGRTVREVARTFDFDVIDSHWVYPDGFAAVRLARRLGKPVVVSARGTDVNDFCYRWPVRHFARQALRGATRVVAVSHALKERMIEVGIPSEKIAVIHNGVDAALFCPGDRSAARRALGLAAEETVLFSAGAILEAKGFQHLIAGIALDPGEPPAHLYIAGPGPYGDTLRSLASAKGVADRVTFLGPVPPERMPLWYRAADFFCFGSLREGCPNVVIEALACGTPVLATLVGAVPDLVQEGRDGVLFEPGSPEAFASALRNALARRWERDAIAERGGRRTWDQVARDYCAVFEHALDDWRARS